MEKSTHLLQPVPLHTERTLSTLVENRSAFTLESCELSVFETHQRAERVPLVFDDLVLTSMLRGKKVMHLFEAPGFEYLPGESVLVPPQEVMTIDFPEANWHNPTQCIALAISKEHIQTTLNLLNEHFPKAETDQQWRLDQEMFHLLHTQELNDIINRFLQISLNDTSREKDLLAGLALRELLIRLMQTQARQFFQKNYLKLSGSHRFAHVIRYIKENIREKLEVEKLSEQACMSRANFFRKFKEEFGLAPADYILKERLKLAKEYLRQPGHSVTQVCYMAGFQNLHYFIRAFKKEVGLTPKAYQSSMMA
ncbi:AraC family transcriptional regulator N-terminal domain-containing protein [Rufibacter sediminis]|uniref:AraC family transcriptional regulator n=1 Tax=Rufibacter sediminis TaxID=2762756 RepID=A0ABR6VR93_9BACT|nr:AraC family transcriptional regulator [Rufibacter sediminis]MBC3539720.1 AraC family transcriptional regulator [Rufibacter sediminis]